MWMVSSVDNASVEKGKRKAIQATRVDNCYMFYNKFRVDEKWKAEDLELIEKWNRVKYGFLSKDVASARIFLDI